jgi:hypothetical protein
MNLPVIWSPASREEYAEILCCIFGITDKTLAVWNSCNFCPLPTKPCYSPLIFYRTASGILQFTTFAALLAKQTRMSGV